jgi:hypothetical protein
MHALQKPEGGEGSQHACKWGEGAFSMHANGEREPSACMQNGEREPSACMHVRVGVLRQRTLLECLPMRVAIIGHQTPSEAIIAHLLEQP